MPPGGETTEHFHRMTEEIYFFTHGSGRMRLGETEREVGPGDTVVIAPGLRHKLWNTGRRAATPALLLRAGVLARGHGAHRVAVLHFLKPWSHGSTTDRAGESTATSSRRSATRRSSSCARLSPKPGVRIYAKLESYNPTGSVKDRVAALDDRARRGGRADRARPDDPRADLGQHRHLAGDDLLAQGLPAQGRDAGQRDRGAHAAAAHVRRRDHLLAGRAGLERRRGDGARAGRGGLVGLHALPVRQPGQPRRPLPRHGLRDPRGARRRARLRRRARHGRHADGQRPPPQGGERRDAGRRRRAAPGRARPGPALAGGRLHPADHRPGAARPQDLRVQPRRGRVDEEAARAGGPLPRGVERRDRGDRRARRPASWTRATSSSSRPTTAGSTSARASTRRRSRSSRPRALSSPPRSGRRGPG